MNTNDLLEDKPFGLFVVLRQKNTSEASRIFCDKIEYIHSGKGECCFDPSAMFHEGCFDHHLMFYKGNELILKVWLRNGPKDKKYKNIREALKAVDIRVVPARETKKGKFLVFGASTLQEFIDNLKVVGINPKNGFMVEEWGEPGNFLHLSVPYKKKRGSKKITIGYGNLQNLVEGLRDIGKVDFKKGFGVKEFNPEDHYIVIEK